MSLGAGFRSIYDDIKNLRLKYRDPMANNLQSMPDISQQRNQAIRRTQSRDRSSVGMWRDARCCCQQRVNESERIRRKVAEENAELRRLCIYLDNQRQQALSELNQWHNARQNGSCWYSDPTCCGSNCEFRCPATSNNAPRQKSSSPVQQQNDELLDYIRSLENRILTLEEGKATIHRDGVLLGKTRRPIRSVSQQHSPTSSTPTSTTRDFTMQPSSQTQQQIHMLDSSQSTLTGSGTTYYSSELDEDESGDEEEDLSDVTTIYVAAKRASNAANNLDNFINQVSQRNDHSDRSTAGLVKKFLSTRETFLQALKKRNDAGIITAPDLSGYAVIQRKNKDQNDQSWNDSYLPPALPKLVMRRKFTADNPMNNGVQLSRQVA